MRRGSILSWLRLGIAGAVALVTQQAQAVVIDFDSLANSGSGFYDVGPTYSEDGFTLALVGTNTLNFVTFGAGEVRYGGSPALYNNNGGGGTALTRDGGGTFSITSIDLANDARFGDTPVTFVGTKPDSTTASYSMTVNTNNALTPFLFPSTFADIVKLEWIQESPYHQFDNITISVPEPSSAILLLGVLASGIAIRRRRRSFGRTELYSRRG